MELRRKKKNPIEKNSQTQTGLTGNQAGPDYCVLQSKHNCLELEETACHVRPGRSGNQCGPCFRKYSKYFLEIDKNKINSRCFSTVDSGNASTQISKPVASQDTGAFFF